MTNLVDRFEFASLLNEPNAADASNVKYFVLDLDSFYPNQRADVAEWIRRQPVPVIGLGSGNRSFIDHFDVVVENEEQLSLLIPAIEAHPKASAILVQVTRVTSDLPVNSALVIESLGYGTLQGGVEFKAWLSDFKTQRPERDFDHHGQKNAENHVESSFKIPDEHLLTQKVIVDRFDARVQIRLNSPVNRNALSAMMRDDLTEAFKLVAMDSTIEEAHVWGEGPCFSAGGDLTEFGLMRDLAEAHRIRQARMPARYLAQEAHRYTFHLHGACVGAGIEIPAFARHVTATPDTFFQLPEVAMGLIPGAGGCVSIPRRIGRQRMNWLALTGIRLSVEEAVAWGLVDRQVEAWYDDHLEQG